MKRLLSAVLILAVLSLYCMPLSAGPTVGNPMQSKLITEDTDLAIAKNKEIYGYTLFTSAGSGYFAFFDKKNVQTATADSDVIDEGGEATAYDSYTVWYPKPLVTDNGLSVNVEACYITLYYQK